MVISLVVSKILLLSNHHCHLFSELFSFREVEILIHQITPYLFSLPSALTTTHESLGDIPHSSYNM